jgi:hypothetical protein
VAVNALILLGNGNGTLAAPLKQYASGIPAQAIPAVGDFNGDGRRDLALVNGFLSDVTILLNNDTCATINQVQPITGPSLGGQSVSLIGTKLAGAILVTFGGSAATITGNTATTITVTTPPHASETTDVVAYTAGGTATVLGGYTFIGGPLAPTGITATRVDVSWNSVAGATSYQVDRKAPGGSFTSIGSPSGTSLSDMSASANTAYLYRVRAVNAGGISANSGADLATTVIFTDSSLVAGVLVKAAHLSELRTAVNAVRSLAGVTAFSFTDTATAGTMIKALHLTQLRGAIDAARSALGFSTGGFTDSSPSGVAVKAIHFQELRGRVQ